VIRVRFVSADGASVRTVEAAPGSRLLDVAQAAGQPLEGACEGALACSTCHVIVSEEDFGRLNAATDAEEDMLDLAFGLTHTSRLGCQIIMSAALDGLTVSLPAATRNMMAPGVASPSQSLVQTNVTNIQAVDAPSFQRLLARNSESIAETVASWKDNGGPYGEPARD
jgi:ferredoxin